MIDPIRWFSRCQAAFIEQSPLEMKIYTFTVSALAGGAYYVVTNMIFQKKDIEFLKNGMGVSTLSWLFLSTVTGYFLHKKTTRT